MHKDRLIEFAQNNRLFDRNDRLVVAVSGGIDSVVLTHLLVSIRQPVVLAHCNFSLRGEESDSDEAFVKALALQWQLPLHLKKFDTRAYAEDNKLSIQVAARQLRYEYFEQLRKEFCKDGKATWIATAHHANDAAETLLMNLFRGTGIDGIRGIPERNGYIIRPLLFAYRSEIEEYAKLHNLSWVDDSSNEKEDYTRNYIRRTVLPAIEKQFPKAVQNIYGSIRVFKDVSVLYHEAVEKRLKKLVVYEKEIQKVPVRKLEKMEQAGTILFEWLRHYNFSEGNIGEVLKLSGATNGSYVASPTHRVLRNRAWLILAPLAAPSAGLQLAESLPFEMIMTDGRMLSIQGAHPFNVKDGIPALPEHEALIDSAAVELPLIIRPWKQGDYFYPLGMSKKKKVSRFLIDQKVSPIDKENVWVVESNKRICWVVGYRIDDRFKLSPQTKQVVRLAIR